MTPDAPKAGNLMRHVPFMLLLIAAGIGYYLYGDALSFEALAENRQRLLALRDAHYALTALGFVAVYVVVVITSLPGSLILTLTGGFLFGVFPGVLFNLSAATFGAVVVFLAARMGFGRDIADRIAAQGGTIAQLQAGLKENEWSVLLTMRLVPVIPFFVANLVPAFVGVGFAAFVITTAVGILPAGLIYTSLGAGLGEIFARGEVPTAELVLRPEFALPLLGLGVLSILPLLIRLYKKGRG